MLLSSEGGAEKRIYEIGRRLAEKHEVHWFGIKWWLDRSGCRSISEPAKMRRLKI